MTRAREKCQREGTPGLLRLRPSEMLDEQVALAPPQTLFRERPRVAELQVRACGGIDARPFGELAVVRIVRIAVFAKFVQ